MRQLFNGKARSGGSGVLRTQMGKNSIEMVGGFGKCMPLNLMKRNLSVILGLGLAALVLPAVAQPPGGRPPGALPPASTNDYSKIFKDDKERNGYAIGMFYGKNGVDSLKGNDLPFDTNAMIQGFTDGMNGNTNRINEEQFRDIVNILRREMNERMMEKRKQMEEKRKLEGEKNKKDGRSVALARQEGTRPGVIPPSPTGPDVQGHHRRQRRQPEGAGHRHGELSRYVDRRHGIRQFLQAGRSLPRSPWVASSRVGPRHCN